jgi:hypothetical protein
MARLQLVRSLRLAFMAALVWLVGASLTADCAWAQRDLKTSCADSYVANQKLRRHGKLSAARDHLLICAQQGCPGSIQSDCVRWLAELKANLPTFVVAAQGSNGSDLVNVRVFVDGRKVADQLDGRPLPIDPGVHKLRFEHDTLAPVEKQVVIQQGMKNRAISVQFQAVAVATSAPGAPTAAPPPGAPVAPAPHDPGPDDSADKPIPVAVIVVLAVLSAGAFATFAGLGITGKNEADDLDVRCGQSANDPEDRGTCDPVDVDNVRTKLIVADVSLGVGIASFAVGLSLLLYNELGDHDPAKVGMSFGVAPTEHGAFGATSWHF